MYVEVESEVEVANGFDEASLPRWHGSRRNAEVISGSKTTMFAVTWAWWMPSSWEVGS